MPCFCCCFAAESTLWIDDVGKGLLLLLLPLSSGSATIASVVRYMEVVDANSTNLDPNTKSLAAYGLNRQISPCPTVGLNRALINSSSVGHPFLAPVRKRSQGRPLGGADRLVKDAGTPPIGKNRFLF